MYMLAPAATSVATTTIVVSITIKGQKHKTDLARLKLRISKMDYHSMELPELKAIAKKHEPKIKHYYIMSRAQLIQVLLMDKFPDKMIIEKKTLKQLQAEAKTKGIPKVWSFRRHELLELLYPEKTETDRPVEKKV
jgi:hypothetical protein